MKFEKFELLYNFFRQVSKVASFKLKDTLESTLSLSLSLFSKSFDYRQGSSALQCDHNTVMT